MFHHDDGFADRHEPAADAEPETLNQPPVEPTVRRDGSDVSIEMTAQVTDLEIPQGVIYNAWTFNGRAPGPVLRVTKDALDHGEASTMLR
jgi:nitrite reductase (NO-forming)